MSEFRQPVYNNAAQPFYMQITFFFNWATLRSTHTGKNTGEKYNISMFANIKYINRNKLSVKI